VPEEVWGSVCGFLARRCLGHALTANKLLARAVAGSDAIREYFRLEHVMRDHAGEVSCLAILPDSRVVSGSHDSVLIVWDPATQAVAHRLEGHADEVRCVEALPDGKIISGSADATIKLWNPDTGKCVRTLRGHEGPILCLAVLPMRGMIASGSADNTLRIWEECKRCTQTLEGHTGGVSGVAVLTNGRVVSGSSSWPNNVVSLPNGYVVSGCDFDVRVWDAIGGDCKHTMGGHQHEVCCLAALPPAPSCPPYRVVSGSLDGTCRVWDVMAGRCLATLGEVAPPAAVFKDILNGRLRQSAAVTCVAALPDGRVVAGARDNSIRVWDAARGSCVQTLQRAKDPGDDAQAAWEVLCVGVCPDGRVAAGCKDALRVWAPAGSR